MRATEEMTVPAFDDSDQGEDDEVTQSTAPPTSLDGLAWLPGRLDAITAELRCHGAISRELRDSVRDLHVVIVTLTDSIRDLTAQLQKGTQ